MNGARLEKSLIENLIKTPEIGMYINKFIKQKATTIRSRSRGNTLKFNESTYSSQPVINVRLRNT
ncbi:hypothetical protein GCM10027428_10240 [Haliea atlantica]